MPLEEENKMIKYDDLIGAPFKLHGRDKQGIDCFGLAVYISKRMGKEIIDHRDEVVDIKDLSSAQRKIIDFKDYYDKVEYPEIGDLVLLKCPYMIVKDDKKREGYTYSVGIVVAPNILLHTDNNTGVYSVRLDSPLYKLFIQGFYRSKTIKTFPHIHGGDFVRTALLGVLAIGAFALGGPISSAIGLTAIAGAGVGGAIVSAGILGVGGFIINSLLPAPGAASSLSSSRAIEESPTYGFNVGKNTAKEGLAIPVIYGEVLTYPQVINSYLDFDSSGNQWSHTLLCLGEGLTNNVVTASDIYANDELLTNLEADSYEVYASNGSNTPDTDGQDASVFSQKFSKLHLFRGADKHLEQGNNFAHSLLNFNDTPPTITEETDEVHTWSLENSATIRTDSTVYLGSGSLDLTPSASAYLRSLNNNVFTIFKNVEWDIEVRFMYESSLADCGIIGQKIDFTSTGASYYWGLSYIGTTLKFQSFKDISGAYDSTYYNASVDLATISEEMNSGTWYHVRVCKSAITQKIHIFVDGVERVNGAFDASSLNITSFADAGSGQVTVTSSGHGLSDGDIVTIAGSVDYNGTFTITNTDANTFEITPTNGWQGNDATGLWVESQTNGNTYTQGLGVAWLTDEVAAATQSFGQGLFDEFRMLNDGLLYPLMSKPISAFGDVVGPTIVITSSSHGLKNNDIVTISGTTNYNKTFTISDVTDNTFEVTHAFLGDEAGDDTIWVQSFTTPSSELTYRQQEIYTTRGDIDEFNIILDAKYGLYRTLDDASLAGLSISFEIGYRLSSGGAWTSTLINLTGTSRYPVKDLFNFVVPTRGQYDIRVIRLTGVVTTAKDQGRTWWVGIDEILDIKLLYPNLQCVSISVRAQDELSNAVPTYRIKSNRTSITVPNFNGAGTQTVDPTVNAYAAFDILTNTLYGAGISPTRLIQVDWDAWVTYCNTLVDSNKRCTFNQVYDASYDVSKALQFCEASGRARILNRGFDLGVVIEQPSAAGYLFCDRNTVPASNTMTLIPQAERSDAVEVQFINKDKLWINDVAIHRTSGFESLGRVPRVVRINMPSINNETEALRYAIFRQQLSENIKRNVSLRSGIEAIRSQMGDVINYQHAGDDESFGGGIDKDIDGNDTYTGTTIYLDQKITLDSATYGGGALMAIRNKDTDEVTIYTIGGPFDEETNAFVLNKSGTFNRFEPYMISKATGKVLQYRIVSIQRTSKQDVQIEALQYVPASYFHANHGSSGTVAL